MRGTIVALCVLGNCAAGLAGPLAAAPGAVAPREYRLSVQVDGIDFTRINGGTLFTIRNPAGRVVASAGFPRVWNSYCANQMREMHVFTSMPSNNAYALTALPKPDATLRSAYGFAARGAVYVQDMANDRQYRIDVTGSGESGMVLVPAPERIGSCTPFIANGRTYRLDAGQIRACRLAGDDPECEDIAIEPGSFPYVYAEHDGRVLVATNWGDILIHGPDGWCRAENVSERYACPAAGMPPAASPAAPTGIQFYSSINYQDKTYLGRFPDGMLFEFDGEGMVLSPDSPPSFAQFGTELQSLANYCGDLFAGFYPRGLLWRRDRETGSWKQVSRLFSHPVKDRPWVPYVGMEPENIAPAFYGQRVTALALLADSLFASTGNLASWFETIGVPEFMTAAQAAEYGTAHRIRRPGCASITAPDASTFVLVFDFTPEAITVRHNDTVLVKVENNGTVPGPGDLISIGEGVFGRLAGVTLNYWTERPQLAAPTAPRPALPVLLPEPPPELHIVPPSVPPPAAPSAPRPGPPSTPRTAPPPPPPALR